MAAAGPSKKKTLFEDEFSEDEDVGASSIHVNEEYVRRFEHNKKREEKQKLEEKYGKDAVDENSDSEDSTSEEEDEYGELLTPKLNDSINGVLHALRTKDPRIYDPNYKFFDTPEKEGSGAEQEAGGEEGKEGKEGKQKPVFLRDYHRERYLRGDVAAEDAEDEDAPPRPKTYNEEQEELRKELINEMAGSDEDGDDDDDDIDSFLKPKHDSEAIKAAAAAQGIHPSRMADAGKTKIITRKSLTKAEINNADKDPEAFLNRYGSSWSWRTDLEEGAQRFTSFASDDEDSQEYERAEEFEHAFNMRFEDPSKSNEALKTYSRTFAAAQSVRREAPTARQRQRERQKEQKEVEKQKEREERTRLRKLQVDEAKEKLAKIKEAAGLRGRKLSEDEWAKLLDDAWDNEQWEAEMQRKFDDEYYAAPDEDLRHGGEEEEEEEEEDNEEGEAGGSKKKKKPKKPKWDDDIDITDIVPDFDEGEKPTVSLSDAEADEAEEAGEEEEEEEEDDDDDGSQPAKRRKTGKDLKKERSDAKREKRLEHMRVEALIDRKMTLDGPSTSSSGSKTSKTAGFRYRETSPESFGLTTRDILFAPSDAALNEFAGLKKLATFRDEERKRRDRKKLGKKARLRKWRQDTFGREYVDTGPTYGFEKFVEEEQTGAEASGKRRKHHKKSDKNKKDSKDKGKGKDKETAEKVEGDGEKTKKKRKRSHKKKEVEEA